jgi:hypothetical protein
METQNITLALRKETLRKVKAIAAKKRTSMSGLLASLLEELVAQDKGYKVARRRHLRTLDEGRDLGTKGKRTWTREDLHARQDGAGIRRHQRHGLCP